jgi:hypothetical protein
LTATFKTSRTFVALQQSESCRTTLLLRIVLCCIVVHGSFYFGSVCQGIKDVNLLQPSSLVDSMFFATTRASTSLSSNFSDVIAGLSLLLADLRTLCSTSCSIPTHSCDSILQQMFSICVIANKNLACAFIRTDCIDMASDKLSALWSDDAVFNAETWTPHPIFKFICSEMMPFLLDYASKNHLLHADTTCCFKLGDWCHVLLLILSNINIIRRCPPCPAEMQLLFSGVFPILVFVSDSTSLQPLLQLLVDVVSISLQPALISSTCSIMKIEPIPHISTSFFRSLFKMPIRVCRERLQVGSGVCQLVAQSFVELLFQSFNATMTQQRASTAKRMYSLWQDLDPQSQFKTKHHNLDLIVRAEIWPIVPTHSLDIDFVIWSEHIGLMCTEGFEELFVLMSSCLTAAGPGSQTFDVVVETISSLVTFSAQNLVISIFDTSMPQSSIVAAEAMFMHICELCFDVLSPLIAAVDASALPVNISTVCGLFGVLFRLISVIIQWKLNIDTESALTTCTSFLKCIARYQDGFSDNAYSKTPIMRRNCQVSDISLFSESARAATHMRSLLFTNDNIITRDVVTRISQVLNALHRVQPVVSSDFVLTTVANVCSRAVGIAPENILKNGNVLQGTKEYQSIPTKVILLRIRELLVALCGGASIAMSKCATALSLLLFTQTNCPVLSIQDRKIVANVCALALQVNFSTEAESLILMNYQGWNAAAGLARSLLALSAGPDEFEQSSAVISSFLHAVPVIVQSLGFMLQNEPGAVRNSF